MKKSDVPTSVTRTFVNPEELPKNIEDATSWQAANRSFWEKNSMRYDWQSRIQYPEFSSEFYEEIDRRFLGATAPTMPWKEIPFEKWIDFDKLKQQDVLEIGVGNGTHAQLIASRAKSYTGIDLTEYAIKSTSSRLALKQIAASIRQMDAENLEFNAESFDFLWSWGVIHHSSNTNRILDEIHRVLRPNGKAVIMVYYRSWYSYYLAGILQGMLKGYFFKGKSIHDIIQNQTDGALARYYTIRSWSDLVDNRFKIERLETLGNQSDSLLIPAGRVKNILLKAIPSWLFRFSLKNLRMGSFLICEMTKK